MTNRISTFFASIAVAVCGLSSSAQVSDYSLQFADFDELKVANGVNVDYYCDINRAGKVEFTADKSLASAVAFECKDGKLIVKLTDKENTPTNLPTVRVYSTYLTSVTNESDSMVRVMSVAPCARFNCKLSGDGSMSIRNVKANIVNASNIAGDGTLMIYGTANTANLKLVGPGSIQADELVAKDVNCTSDISGVISCYATEKLTCGGVGGTVKYRGEPVVKKRTLSYVKVKKIEE